MWVLYLQWSYCIEIWNFLRVAVYLYQPLLKVISSLPLLILLVSSTSMYIGINIFVARNYPPSKININTFISKGPVNWRRTSEYVVFPYFLGLLTLVHCQSVCPSHTLFSKTVTFIGTTCDEVHFCTLNSVERGMKYGCTIFFIKYSDAGYQMKGLN